MRKDITCCYNCTDRQVGCHGTCERYKAERAEMDEYRAHRIEEIRKSRRGVPNTAAKSSAIHNENRRTQRRGRKWDA